MQKVDQLVLGVGVLLGLLLGPVAAASAIDTADRAAVLASFHRLPLAFEANAGQTDASVRFVARGPGYTVYVADGEAVMVLRRAPAPLPLSRDRAAALRSARLGGDDVIRMRLVGARPQAEIEGLDRLPGTVGYFTGTDPARWHSSIATYGRVQYRNVYPGIDVVYYGNQRALEYDLLVAAGANPDVIRLAFAGAQAIAVNPAGDLALRTSGGEVRMVKPVIYQEIDGVRRPVSGRYVVHGGGEVGFDVPSYDTTRALVIDPVINYSTFLGGSGEDIGIGIAVDPAGNAYVTGLTDALNFPVVNAVQPAPSGGLDAFVTKINRAGSALVYSTYLGGGGTDVGFGVAVTADAAGNAFVTGATDSPNFPTTPGAFRRTPAGSFDVFVTKLSPSGSSLVYSTYLGGTGDDFGFAIALDASRNAYVTGETLSTNFPTKAPQPGPPFGGVGGVSGFGDAFVTKLNAAGSALVFSRYLGGSEGDTGRGIAVNAAGDAHVTGFTDSLDFPTKNALQPVSRGLFEVFVTKLRSATGELMYSTYLGGANNDFGNGIALDADSNAYVVGETQSPDFPTTPGVVQPTFRGGPDDAFVAKLSPQGSALVYSTYLGGTADDLGNGVAVDAAGNAHVAGSTTSPDFPLTAGGFTYRGAFDAFATKLNGNASAVTFSTFLGGVGHDFGFGVALSRVGEMHVTGGTVSPDFPTTAGAFQRVYGGGAFDAFVTAVVPNGAPDDGDGDDDDDHHRHHHHHHDHHHHHHRHHHHHHDHHHHHHDHHAHHHHDDHDGDRRDRD